MQVLIWLKINNNNKIVLLFTKSNNVLVCNNINLILNNNNQDILIDIIDENWKNIITKLKNVGKINKIRRYDI